MIGRYNGAVIQVLRFHCQEGKKTFVKALCGDLRLLLKEKRKVTMTLLFMKERRVWLRFR